MKVNVDNNFTLGEGNFLITDIDGLDAADIRTSQFLFSGRSGGLVTDQFYGFRQLSVSGKIVSPTCEQHQTDRETFLNNVPIDTTIPIYVTNFIGETFVIYCNVVKPAMRHLPGGQMSDYLLQLIAGDPLFYSLEGGEEQSATVNRVTQGGYDTPYILPVEWDSGSAPTIVLNSGNAVIYPVITLSDEAANPTITNQTTGESFSLDINMIGGDEVVIDMFNRTVTLNGASIMGNRTSDSIWWGLQVGNNSIVLDSDSASDDVTAEITWRNGITGI